MGKMPPLRVISEPSLSVLVCESVVRKLEKGKPEHAKFRKAFFKMVGDNLNSRDWKSVSCHSKFVADYFDLTDEPKQDDFDPLDMCRYLWGVTHCLCVWDGQKDFQEVLEACSRIKRKLRLYVPNEEYNGLMLIDTKDLNRNRNR